MAKMNEIAQEEILDEEDIEFARLVAAAPPVKAPQTRLLDLLAGWSRYAERDEFPDSEEITQKISDLYQEAGGLNLEGLSHIEAGAKFVDFLLLRVLPLLVGEEITLAKMAAIVAASTACAIGEAPEVAHGELATEGGPVMAYGFVHTTVNNLGLAAMRVVETRPKD